MVTLISSFHNEEYLLPWWLSHHKDMFNHAVLFDYYSTDRSVEIIRKMCPHWEVRKTRNKDWNFEDNDKEFMDAERGFEGYKIVLTTTEFLVGDFPDWSDRAYAIPFYRVIDDKPEEIPTYEKPLVEQKNTRYIDNKDYNKFRFLHNHPTGRYYVGRHWTKHTTMGSDMFVYKYVFAPWTEEFIQRKLNMKKHMSESDVKDGKGKHHTWERDKLMKEYEKALCMI